MRAAARPNPSRSAFSSGAPRLPHGLFFLTAAARVSLFSFSRSPDYKEYVVAVDVRAYHHAFTQLTDLRNYYVRAHTLFAKNAKRLADPRGEGDDGRAHSMSMF